jgi:hypothetical protein
MKQRPNTSTRPLPVLVALPAYLAIGRFAFAPSAAAQEHDDDPLRSFARQALLATLVAHSLEAALMARAVRRRGHGHDVGLWTRSTLLWGGLNIPRLRRLPAS